MTTPVTFPDAEELVRAHLAEQLPGRHVCTQLPDPDEFEGLLTGGIVLLERIGGTWTARKRIDNPRLEISALTRSLEATNDLLKNLRALVEAMTGLTRNGGVVTHTGEETGPRTIPDPSPDVIRRGFVASLHIRPA
ncbi:hypothetical protein [Actinomadura sp. 3N508]|uniref:phage tail termination protein n=1 Tax=Actinomadura sp. 3N508 TaxID=3375153 RepID=UPI0037A04C71